MGCITGKAWRVSGIPSAGASRVGGIYAGASRIGGIKAYASLICTVDKGMVLKVVPSQPQWVDVGLYASYKVTSNGEWDIK
jgi:hypothetical protein